MKTNATFPEVLHFDPTHACCETPAAADLFPDLLRLNANIRHRGRVASAVVESCGNGVQARSINVDDQAWEACVESPNFRACYDLSMAKLALQDALAGR